MSHFKIELSSEKLNNWKMIVHLHVLLYLRSFDCSAIKIDHRARVMPNAPINVHCGSIFNDIPPILDLDWWSLNNGQWLIRTQAWAVSVKE